MEILYSRQYGMKTPNLDNREIDRFNAVAAVWWDRKGPLRALHDINPVRSAYVADRTKLGGKHLIEVGCGGGLLAEALARHGAHVTAIDMANDALAVAHMHSTGDGLRIDYKISTAEQMAQYMPQAFDVVTCMELLEHVPDPASLVAACANLLRPGGDLFFATVNRTILARLLVVWIAEYMVGIVKKGTHDHRKFVRPAELSAWGLEAGLRVVDLTGLRYLPFIGKAGLCRNTALNYMMHFKKPA